MDSLDNLTNEQLRAQLVEHGLANMPVTNTTRKVLIKRLRTAIDGGGGDKTTKSRRETIHVAKISSGDESESDKKTKEPAKPKSSRRATINVAAASSIPVKTNIPVLAPVVVDPPVSKPVTTRRSSGRITPVAVASEPPVAVPKPISKAPQIVDVPEEPEDDTQFIPISQKRLPRSSRSPSMSKSATVTTSFNQVLVKSKPIIEETVELSDEEVDEEEDIVDVDEIEDNEPETSGELEIGNYTTSYLAGFNDTRTSPAATRYESKTSNRSSIATSYATSSAYRPPSHSNDYNTSVTQRRYTTSDWNRTLDDRQRTPEKKDIGVTDVHTPYLSDFTRRLSKLRAEPLTEASALRRDSDNAIDGTEFSSNYYRTSSQVHGRLQRTQPDDSVWAHIKTLIISIERKYRYVLWAIVLVLLAIFLTTIFLA